MKLGKRYIFAKILFFFLFMIIIFVFTINYLYYTDNINSSDYLKLILRDSYDNNFYNNLVEFISNNINPLRFVEFNNEKYTSFSSIDINNPIIYIYNSNQSLSYKVEYNNKPDVMLAAYYLSNELNKNDINNIFEDTIVGDNDIEFIKFDKLKNYDSIKYIIDIGRSDNKSYIMIDDLEYAGINLYANKSNISFIKKLHNVLNNNCKGISKIYYSSTYNDDIRIDIGGYNSSMSTVLRSIKILSKSISEVING